MEALRYLTTHQAHDSARLIRRWRAVARQSRLNLSVLHTAGDFPVLLLRSKRLSERAIYLSAGVHGDEPAAAGGLLEWAERYVQRLADAEVVILPLFNPVGIQANTRVDGGGVDLNRMFQDDSHAHIASWRRAVAGLRFQMAAMLHEDYDAQGVYCYELNAGKPMADALLKCVESVLPRDPRRRIDGRAARNGVIRRSHAPADLPGLPEAIELYHRGAKMTLTFETPSEHALYDRVRAHSAFVEALFDQSGW